MGWRDKCKVHPAADKFPMMSKRELEALGKDIKAYGLKNPIVVWRDEDGEESLIDGRNRLEAMELVGVELDPSRIEYVTCGDPVSWIKTLNLYRRHLTKQQYASLVVKMLQAKNAWDKAKAKKPAQVEEVSKGGRGKVNEVKAEAVAMLAPQGVSESTIERALAEGRTPKPKPRRRPEEIERDKLLGVRGTIHGMGYWKFSDAAVALISKDEATDLAEDVKMVQASLGTLGKQLQRRLEPEAA